MPLSETSLLSQIASGEDSTRQFKADIRNAESLASELAAFANSEGGTLYAGSLDDAFAANRWDPCDTCAGGAEAKLDDAAAGDTIDTAEQPAG